MSLINHNMCPTLFSTEATNISPKFSYETRSLLLFSLQTSVLIIVQLTNLVPIFKIQRLGACHIHWYLITISVTIKKSISVFFKLNKKFVFYLILQNYLNRYFLKILSQSYYQSSKMLHFAAKCSHAWGWPTLVYTDCSQ